MRESRRGMDSTSTLAALWRAETTRRGSWRESRPTLRRGLASAKVNWDLCKSMASWVKGWAMRSARKGAVLGVRDVRHGCASLAGARGRHGGGVGGRGGRERSGCERGVCGAAGGAGG